MSGHCDFCGIWHSGSCCHPGRATVAFLESEVERLRRELATARAEAYLDASKMTLSYIPNPLAAKKSKALMLVGEMFFKMKSELENKALRIGGGEEGNG